LGLATVILNPDCDMLLNARVDGSQMQGTRRSGREWNWRPGRDSNPCFLCLLRPWE